MTPAASAPVRTRGSARGRRTLRAMRRNVLPAVIGLAAALALTLHSSAVAMAPEPASTVTAR